MTRPRVYYNEKDPYAAQWLRNLIMFDYIAPGDVDERSIEDVKPDDLRGYVQCHFFAGIGVWSHALRRAGWPDDRPVWTGSCPCQPFSAAGKGEGTTDARHLWPDWFRLIREHRPVAIFGEQVGAAIRHGWLDLVSADMEGIGYALGSAVVGAHSVGAPHIRQRLYFVADSRQEQRRWGARQQRSAGKDTTKRHEETTDNQRVCAVGELADSERRAAERHGHELAKTARGVEGEAHERQRVRLDVRNGSDAGGMGDANNKGPQGRSVSGATGKR